MHYSLKMLTVLSVSILATTASAATITLTSDAVADDGQFNETVESATADSVQFFFEGGNFEGQFGGDTDTLDVSAMGLGVRPDSSGAAFPQINRNVDGVSYRQLINIGVDPMYDITEIVVNSLGQFASGAAAVPGGDSIGFNGQDPAVVNQRLVIDVSSLGSNVISLSAGTGDFTLEQVTATLVPEPASLVLLTIGGIALAGRRGGRPITLTWLHTT